MAGNSAILSVRIIGDAAGATKAYKDAEGAADKFGAKMSKMSDVSLLAGVGAGAALTKGLFDAVDADSANRKLAGQLNLGAEDAKKAGELSGRLYGQAYGDNLEEVNGAISAVASSLASFSVNGGADVERLSKKALDLSATFGTDVNAAVGTAGILLKNGLAKNGDEAFDLLVGSMQKVPAGMRDELLPVMDEYSKHFAALGIDGTTAFGMMVEASQQGAIGMDKAGDALKEFTIRATDGSTSTQGAMESIGLNATDMARQLLAGGKDANDAMGQIVHGLQNIDDPAKQAQAALALFGTPLEDLGTDQIPNFLGTIDPMGDAFDSVAGAADNLGKTVSDGPGVAIESFTRQAGQQFQDFAAGALPYIQPILTVLMQFLPAIVPIAAAIAIVTAAQMAWNAAQAANPMGLVVIAITAFIAGIILAYNNVGWFRDAVDAMGRFAVQVWEWIVQGVNNFITWLNEALAPVGGIQGALQLLGQFAGEIWQGIVDWITKAIDWLNDVLEPIGGIQGALNIAGDVAGKVFGGINKAIEGTIGWIKSAITWFASLFANKQKADSVGNADGGAMPLMGTQSLTGTAPLVGTQSLAGTQSLTGTAPLVGTQSLAGTSSTLGGMAGGSLRLSAGTTVNITVKADATTDGVELGKQLVRTINKALTAQGSPKLATI